jgi:uncharacterized repeat protein (TIGR03803 family)
MSRKISHRQSGPASLLRQKSQPSLRSSATKTIWMLCLICAGLGAAQAQTNILASFNGTDGEFPTTALIQGSDGNFYGTTATGGLNDFLSGVAYRVTPAGDLTSIYSFCSLSKCADGSDPDAPLALGTDGNFYGTTANGGLNSGGTVFRLTPAGVLTTLYNFCALKKCPDGSVPRAGLVLADDGNFWGTTSGGGKFGGGTIFRISTAGKFISIYNFCSISNCGDGSSPMSGLVQARNGILYGTTYDGGTALCPFFGTFGCGTIFAITLSGNLTTLYNIGDDAGLLTTPLIFARNGNLYGASENGGTIGGGSIFEITPAGAYSTIYSFCSQTFCTDGDLPRGGLVQATNGILYGTTSTGGTLTGTVFSISAGGTLHTIHNFTGFAHGSMPEGSLLQATDGNFYGLVNSGGVGADGALFRVLTGLPQFVRTVPLAGAEAAQVLILGNNLSTTTAVSFNGTAASFTVVSDSEIETTVPSGASAGFVTVTTSAGTLNSNVAFRVLP